MFRDKNSILNSRPTILTPKYLNAIKITKAHIKTGDFKFSLAVGDYTLIENPNGNDRLLEVEFEIDENARQEMDYIYITNRISNNQVSGDYAHITHPDQRSFSFKIENHYPLNEFKIFGFKLNLALSNRLSRPSKDYLVSESLPIVEFLPIAEFVQNGLSQLNNSLSQQSLFSAAAENPSASVEKRSADIPQSYLCMITLEIMRRPVICTLDGKTYEKSAITEWLTKHRTSPYTRAPMLPDQQVADILVSNRNLQETIEDYLAEHPSLGMRASR